MAWEGLRRAIAEDPEGVRAVLSVIRRIPQSPDRAVQSPPLWAEVAWWIERESGWRPDARHPQTDASGLIQWMPRTAAIYGLTPEQIRALSRGDQAPLIERYLTAVTRSYGPLRAPGQVYVAGAYPLALTYPPNRVIAEQGSAIWQQNPGWRDPQHPEQAVTVRRLLEYGAPPPVPDDLRAALLALVPDLETASTTAAAPAAAAPSGTSGQAASGASGHTTAVVPASGASGQQGAGGTTPPSTPAEDTDWGEILLWALALGAVAAAARKGCLP